MTSKTLFKNLYQFEAKRNRWLLGVSMFIAFLCMPFMFVNRMMMLSNTYSASFKNVIKLHPEAVKYQLNNFTYYNACIWLYLGVFAVLNGIFLFSYLHSKEKQDFYFGQPIKRSTLFWCNILQGIVNVMVPYFISFVLTILAAVFLNVCSGTFVLMLIQSFFVNTLFFLATYGFTVVATILTGNLIYAILGTGALLGYFPACIMIVAMMFNGNLPNVIRIENALSYGSPVTILVQVYEGISSDVYYNNYSSNLKLEAIHPIAIVTFLIWIAVTFAAARYLYGKRNAEGAGKPIAFPKGKGIIKAFLAVLVAVACAFIFPELFGSESIVYSIIGLIAGTILGLYLLDILMDLNFKSFFKNWKKQIVYAAVICVVFGGIEVYATQYRYSGFADIPKDYTKEQAMEDGCLVMDDSYQPINDSVWDDFYQKTKKGEDASLRIVTYYENDADYTDIIFEFGVYNVYQSYSVFEHETYKYIYDLRGASDDGIDDDDEKSQVCFLSNNEDVTYDFIYDYMNGYLSWDEDYVENFSWYFIFNR